ncbi:MAG: response regulator transcription factor [Sphingomonadales bacterium]|nr:response regulator transcription factor [Sphingomonadales bacterium]
MNRVALAGKTERAKMLRKVNIFLWGKNEIGREGLKKILSSDNFHIQASVSDAVSVASALAQTADEEGPQVVVIDPGADSSWMVDCKLLAQEHPRAKLVLLSDRYVFDDVALAFQNGVDAVIVKEISCDPLIESIHLVALGEKVFPSQLAGDLVNCVPSTDTGDWRMSAIEAGLSSREIEILESIMAGMANKVIARKFDICEATVKVHVKAILRKLAVENRTQAATWAVKHSIAAPSTTVGIPQAQAIGPITHIGRAA